MFINSGTQVCAVIGNPVRHSLSPAIHNAAFGAMGLDFVYVAFRVEDVGGCLSGMRACEGFRGMSVTIPHKAAVIPYLDELDPMAEAVGSVNTIVHEDGKLIGSTTDGLGALLAFSEAGVNLNGRSVVFLGAGGAVRSVAFALAHRTQPERLTILGRTVSRVEGLVNELRHKTSLRQVAAGELEGQLAAVLADHDVIIQGTPAGMYPEYMSDTLVDARLLRPEHVIFDMVYRPLKTRLIREAEEAGSQTILGLEMLLNQAALQFELWTNLPAPRHVMREALIKALETDQ